MTLKVKHTRFQRAYLIVINFNGQKSCPLITLRLTSIIDFHKCSFVTKFEIRFCYSYDDQIDKNTCRATSAFHTFSKFHSSMNYRVQTLLIEI